MSKRRLFVGCLSPQVTKEALEEFFEKHKPKDIQVMRSRVHEKTGDISAWVTFNADVEIPALISRLGECVEIEAGKTAILKQWNSDYKSLENQVAEESQVVVVKDSKAEEGKSKLVVKEEEEVQVIEELSQPQAQQEQQEAKQEEPVVVVEEEREEGEMSSEETESVETAPDTPVAETRVPEPVTPITPQVPITPITPAASDQEDLEFCHPARRARMKDGVAPSPTSATSKSFPVTAERVVENESGPLKQTARARTPSLIDEDNERGNKRVKVDEELQVPSADAFIQQIMQHISPPSQTSPVLPADNTAYFVSIISMLITVINQQNTKIQAQKEEIGQLENVLNS